MPPLRPETEEMLARLRTGLSATTIYQRGANEPRPTWNEVIRAVVRTAAPHTSHHALFAFAFDFLVWWHEAGDRFYGKRAGDGSISVGGCTYQYDEGLRSVAVNAVAVLGGWRMARTLLRIAGAHATEFDGHPAARHAREVYLRE